MAPRTRSMGKAGEPGVSLLAAAAGGGQERDSLWLAPTPAKRFCELLWLGYSPFWIVWALGIVVPLRLYDSFTEWGYMYLCAGSAAPCLLLPLLFRGADPERHLPIWDRCGAAGERMVGTAARAGHVGDAQLRSRPREEPAGCGSRIAQFSLIISPL